MNFKICALFVLLCVVCQVKSDCSASCASCGNKKSADYCFVCQNSTWNDGSCSGKGVPNCLFHSATGCLTCQPSYVLSKDDFSCTLAGANKIDNCAVQWSQMNTKKVTEYFCNVCNGSAPSKD